MSRHNLAWLVGICSVCLFGVIVVSAAPSRAMEDSFKLVRLRIEVDQRVLANFIEPLDEKEQRKYAEAQINGGLSYLDPYSEFIGEEQFKEFQQESSGKFSGIGVHVGYKPGYPGEIEVLAPIPGSPAYRAGVAPGDRILQVDNLPTEDLKFREVIDKIKGPKGTKVKLTIQHPDGKEKTVLVTRDDIKVMSVRGDERKKDKPEEWDFMLDKEHKIGYVRLTGFTETATQEMKDALTELIRQGVRGLILDLRYNGGGLLTVAEDVSDLFLSEGRIVSIRGRTRRFEARDATKEPTVFGAERKVPIVILVNRKSASASEILAAALQDHGRAVVMGERSFGKGSVQNVIPMEDKKTALKITTATYWRPSDKNIHRNPRKVPWNATDNHDWGVRPNKGLELKKPLTEVENYEHYQWRRSRDLFVAGGKKPSEAKPYVDRVREKALEHLRKSS